MVTHTRALCLAALAALTLAVYLPLQAAPFVYEDANGLAGATDPVVWRAPSRALTAWTLQWTRDASVAHRTNVALHVANGVLVGAVAAALIPGSAAVWAAGVYLLHPLNSAAASYVSARTDLLLTLCVLLALLGAVRGWWPLLALGLVGAAVSKEVGLVAVPLVWLTLWWWKPEAWRTRLAILLAGFFVVVGNASTLAAWLTIVPNAGGSAWGWRDFLLLQATALWQLVGLLVPIGGFSIDHDPVGVSETWRIVAVMALGAVCAVVAALWRRTPLLTWCALCVGLAVLPRFLFRTSEFLTEPQMALPMVGLSVGLGAVAAWLWGQARPQESYV